MSFLMFCSEETRTVNPFLLFCLIQVTKSKESKDPYQSAAEAQQLDAPSAKTVLIPLPGSNAHINYSVPIEFISTRRKKFLKSITNQQLMPFKESP